MDTTIEERFWMKVDKTPNSKGCWNWTGFRHRGYGDFRNGAKMVRAHRYSYELNVSLIPEGMNILHSCDNPSCVNPDHLTPGTQLENVTDMMNKGRKIPAHGSRNAWAKLSEDGVRIIRRNLGNLTDREFAEIFNVKASIINKVKHYKSWTHVN